MTLYRTLRTLMILGGAALTLASSVTAKPAQAAPAGMPSFGSVDITKIQSQSAKKTKYDSDLRALAERLNGAFKLQTQSPLLSKAEQTELGTLLTKTNPTDTDRTRISALQAQSGRITQEFTDLQQAKSPTPADTARLAALTDQARTGQATLQEIGDGYQAQLKALSDRDNTEFTQNVREAIIAIAQQKGLSVVFTSDIAVYTANDITDDVVKRINK